MVELEVVLAVANGDDKLELLVCFSGFFPPRAILPQSRGRRRRG